MIKDIKFINNALFINTYRNGIEKKYIVSKKLFIAQDISYGRSLEVSSLKINNLSKDGSCVMSILEELQEIGNLDIASLILKIYLMDYTVKDVYKRIVFMK